jgi:cyclophilin family peptidyl-prolyl cis-trans isomerase
MLFFTTIVAALICFAAAAAPNGSSSAPNTSYNLRKLREHGAIATVTVHKPMVTVYQQGSQVTVTVNKEAGAHSKVVVETAIVTHTVKIKNPSPDQQNGHPSL